MTDAQQFECFVKQHQNMVYSASMRLLVNHAEAQDVAQEVFLKAFERWDQLRDSPTAGGWLRTVATNLSLNHLSRYRKRWRFFSEMRDENDAEAEPLVNQLPAGEPLPESRGEEVNLALQRLPQTQRVPLVLFHFDGLGYEEIATRLNVSLGKVKTDIFRGREALRKSLRLTIE